VVILWTARSLRNLEKELKKLGHNVSPMTVGKLLRSMDYSLQANSKTKEGRQHVDRDAQFQYIDEQSRAFLKARQPVISCDTKKKRTHREFQESWSGMATEGSSGSCQRSRLYRSQAKARGPLRRL
jgi:hypothetical protein